MNSEFKNGDSYEQLYKKRRKTWQNRLLRWTWITVATLVKVTFRVAVGIIWVIAVLVGSFLDGFISANSMVSQRHLRRAKGDSRWG